MNINKQHQKVVSFVLSLFLLFYSLAPAFPYRSQVLAEGESTDNTTTTQDTTPTETPSDTSVTPTDTPPADTTATENTTPTSTPTPDSSSSEQPAGTPTEVPPPTPTPFDPYHHPSYSSPEYDEWKEQYNIWKAEQDQKEAEAEAAQDAQKEEEEQRDNEWETHEEDDTWREAHGGSEDYYVSGGWEADQQAAQEAEANSADDQFTPPDYTGQSESQCSNDDYSDPYSTPSTSTSSTGTVNGTAVSENNDTSTVNNDNCASINNDGYAGGISGENSQTKNDGSTSMTTGGVNADGTLVNNGNYNSTDADNLGTAQASAGDSLAQGSEAENLNTGEDSENLAYAQESNTLTVGNDNEAYVDNSLAVEGTSGANTVTDNDGNATLTTGDIELIANMLNILNLNITGDDFLHLIVNIFGELTGDLDMDTIAQHLGYEDDEALEVIAKNENTGDDSNNTAIAEKNDELDVNNTNYAEVNNTMNVTATSGSNDVSGNDGEATVVTGRIQVLANLLNFINGNFTGSKWKFIMVNIFGSLTGNIVVPGTDPYLDGEGGQVLAENTGGGGDANATSTSSSLENTTVNNNNSVDLNNNITADGISGNNNQNNNDAEEIPQTTQTGQVDVATNLLNFLNFNIFGNNWVFLVVNVFGTWMGQIVGFADSGNITAPSEGTFAALKVGGESEGAYGEDASASTLGDGSDNNATAEYNSNTTVNNNNEAIVSNNMNIEGISGENDVNNNQGSTKITTGWVEIDANLLNIINMNITGRNWLVVFLNVFGDFAGNLFFGTPPPHAQDTASANDQTDNSNSTNDSNTTNNDSPPNNNTNNNSGNSGNNGNNNNNNSANSSGSTSNSANNTASAFSNTSVLSLNKNKATNTDSELSLAASEDNSIQLEYVPLDNAPEPASFWESPMQKIGSFFASLFDIFRNFLANNFLFAHIRSSLQAGL